MFGKTITLSNDAGHSDYAQMAVSSNNNVKVLWLDTTTSAQNVFFRKSGSGGGDFGCTLNISDSPGDKSRINLALVNGGNNIFTTWTGDSTGNFILEQVHLLRLFF